MLMSPQLQGSSFSLRKETESDLQRIPGSGNQRSHSKPNRATSVDYKAPLSRRLQAGRSGLNHMYSIHDVGR